MTDTLESSITALLERIVGCFRRERVPYVLIGAWALAVWGRPRATNDVDILVLVKEADLPALSDRIIRAGLTLDETWKKWNPLLRGFQLRFQFGGVTGDVMRPRDALDEQVLKRKQGKRLDGHHGQAISSALGRPDRRVGGTSVHTLSLTTERLNSLNVLSGLRFRVA